MVKPASPKNTPNGGRPRGSRLWACTAYLRGRTRTLAILAMSYSLSSFNATIRRQTQNLSACPANDRRPALASHQTLPSNTIYTIFPCFSSRNHRASPC